MDKPGRSLEEATQNQPDTRNKRKLRRKTNRKPMASIEELHEGSESCGEASSHSEDANFNLHDFKMEEKPIRRRISRALSEIGVPSQPLPKTQQQTKVRRS